MVTELQQIENDIKIRRDFFEAKMKPFYEKKNKLHSEILDKKNKNLIGKCFKFRNGYGGEEKWWLYYKVVDIKSGFNDLLVITVEEPHLNSGDYVEIKMRDTHRDMLQTEITEKEFNLAYEKALQKINKLEIYCKGKKQYA